MAANQYDPATGMYVDANGQPTSDPNSGAAGQPTGIPDPSNPGYDTAGFPLPAATASPQTATGTFFGTPPGGTGLIGGGGPANGFTYGPNTTNNGQPLTYTPPAPPAPSPSEPSSLSNIFTPFTGTYTPIPAPTAQTPPPFSYGTPLPQFQSFTQPTLAEAQQAPGFQFAEQQGDSGIENSAAASGLLNSGATLKNILAYNQNFANQNYQNVFNNDYTTWQGNQAGALNNWVTGDQAALSAYNTNVSSQYQQPFTNALASTSMDNANNWQNFLQQYQIATNNQTIPFGMLTTEQGLGAAAAGA